MDATTVEPAPSPRRLVTLGVLTGTALAALEATVVGAAMPTVIASVGGLHHHSRVFSAERMVAAEMATLDDQEPEGVFRARETAGPPDGASAAR